MLSLLTINCWVSTRNVLWIFLSWWWDQFMHVFFSTAVSACVRTTVESLDCIATNAEKTSTTLVPAVLVSFTCSHYQCHLRVLPVSPAVIISVTCGSCQCHLQSLSVSPADPASVTCGSCQCHLRVLPVSPWTLCHYFASLLITSVCKYLLTCVIFRLSPLLQPGAGCGKWDPTWSR